jgi:hypothetical protein
MVNAIPDSGGLTARSAGLSDLGPLAFGSAGLDAPVPEGRYTVQLTPGASGSAPFSAGGVDAVDNALTTVVAYGTLAGGVQNALQAQVPAGAPDPGRLRMQPVHAAYQEAHGSYNPFATLYFYFLSPPGAPFTTATPTLTVSFGPAAPPQSLTLPAGTYEIFATPLPECLQGQPCPATGTDPRYYFASGPKGISLPMSDGSDTYQAIVIDAGGTQSGVDGSLMSLVLLGNKGGSVQLFNGQQ